MKKFKTKSHHKFKTLFIVLEIIIFLLLFVYLSFQKLNINCYDMVKILLSNFSFEKENLNVVKLYNLDYLIKNMAYQKEEETYTNNNQLIYLYNTHDNERYQDGSSVIDASTMLKNNLEKLGIKTYLENQKVSDYQLTNLSSYDISRNFIMDRKEKYSYYIDIHRDSVNNTTIELNKKKYAKLLFVLGLDNPNYQENKKILEKMHQYLENNYPGLSKGIYEKQGVGVNGVYNQDLGSNVLLIEIGGVENNQEEINNSTEIIALMMYHMLGDNK